MAVAYSGSLSNAVNYPPGWNLVAGPPGTTFANGGVAAALYTYQPGDADYEVIAPFAEIQAGAGYWLLLETAKFQTLAPSGPQSVMRRLPPNQTVMIGNPGQAPVTVTGADSR